MRTKLKEKPLVVGYDPTHLPRQRPARPPAPHPQPEDLTEYVSVREVSYAYVKLAGVVAWRGAYLACQLVGQGLVVVGYALSVLAVKLSDELAQQRHLAARRRQFRQWSREAKSDNPPYHPTKRRTITVTTKIHIDE